jgi:riboflavin synthase
MFTGIIEVLGKVEKIEKEATNIHLTISSPISDELKVDQSVSHNGVCLTVVALEKGQHTVTAIEETLIRTSLGSLKEGDWINIERAMSATSRFDGHFVQGHVDTTGKCIAIESVDGSWYFSFQYTVKPEWLLVDKGSVCINGVSLTVVEPQNDTFSVAIIPYTYNHTVFKDLKVNDTVNLEFDVIGKYITKYMQLYKNS